jgi:predicted glycosyltransferase involved in capsule biosynthesis
MNNTRYDLTDVTFLIPFRGDSQERIQNLNLSLSFLNDNFITNVILWENDKMPKASNNPEIKNCKYVFEHNSNSLFHRTKILNNMTRIAETKYICLYDCDVIFEPKSIILAHQALNSGMEVVYPYSGVFLDIPREYAKKDLFNMGINNFISKFSLLHTNSLGAAIFLNKESYINAGMENENFKSWGYEDLERFERFSKLGLSIARINGACFHFTHPRDENSCDKNPYYNENIKEYEKIKSMDANEIKKYLKC